MNRESDFRKELQRRIRKAGGEPTPVENSAQLGTFDTHCAMPKRSRWLELKYAHGNEKPDVSGPQIGFAIRQKRAGQEPRVLVCRDGNRVQVLDWDDPDAAWQDTIEAEFALPQEWDSLIAHIA